MATVAERTTTVTKLAASLDSFSDLDILGILSDLGADEEEIPTHDISVRVFGSPANNGSKVHCHRSIGSRMAWMKRIGLIVKGEQPGTWQLSPLGNELHRGRLPMWRLTAMSDLEERQTLHLAEQVGRSILTSRDAFPAMERQLRHYVLRRKRA